MSLNIALNIHAHVSDSYCQIPLINTLHNLTNAWKYSRAHIHWGKFRNLSRCFKLLALCQLDSLCRIKEETFVIFKLRTLAKKTINYLRTIASKKKAKKKLTCARLHASLCERLGMCLLCLLRGQPSVHCMHPQCRHIL